MRWKFHAGLFLTTLSLLNLELLLTRIFSVTMWYHFAFMAISLAMFGVAGGAVLVGIRPPADPTAALAGHGKKLPFPPVMNFCSLSRSLAEKSDAATSLRG